MKSRTIEAAILTAGAIAGVVSLGTSNVNAAELISRQVTTQNGFVTIQRSLQGYMLGYGTEGLNKVDKSLTPIVENVEAIPQVQNQTRYIDPTTPVEGTSFTAGRTNVVFAYTRLENTQVRGLGQISTIEASLKTNGQIHTGAALIVPIGSSEEDVDFMDPKTQAMTQPIMRVIETGPKTRRTLNIQIFPATSSPSERPVLDLESVKPILNVNLSPDIIDKVTSGRFTLAAIPSIPIG